MPRTPRLLTATEAKRTLAHRLSPRVDSLRQFATKFGIRPYQVFLVWGRWTGDERGEGKFREVKTVALTPTPKVEDLSAVAMDPRSAGILPVGSLRVSRISARYGKDLLSGIIPEVSTDGERLPADVEFFYEVREDGRSGEAPERMRFRLSAEPFRRAGKVDWTILLERISEDRSRTGREQIGADVP